VGRLGLRALFGGDDVYARMRAQRQQPARADSAASLLQRRCRRIESQSVLWQWLDSVLFVTGM